MSLRGVRVLDMSRALAGPYCSMILGDLGAEVIKVERPVTGDDARSWGPPFIGDESVYFLSVNRNKKSICIDLKREGGRRLVERLALISDVLIENFLPGKMDAMGLGFEALSRIAPRLIYASITGFGSSGPYSQRGGYDFVGSAMGGLTNITGPSEGDPCRVGIAMTDITTGLYCHGAILAALFQRERQGPQGKGVKIDTNLLSSQVACLSHVGACWLNSGIEGRRYGTAHGTIVPYQAFKTGDGRLLVIATGNNSHFLDLCRRLDLEDLTSDERFVTNSLRVKNRHQLVPILEKRFSEKCMDEWLEKLDGSGVPYGPINSLQETFADPQVIQNDMICSFDHPTAGPIRVPGDPVQYATIEGVKEKKVSPPPLLGEHTDFVLESLLNISKSEIEQLRGENVVF